MQYPRRRPIASPLEVCGRRPRVRSATVMGPASENLHRTGRHAILCPAHGPAQLVAGAGHIGLVAQRYLLPKSGAYSCSHHAMRFLVANIRTDGPPWQIIEGRRGRIAATKTCYPGNILITILQHSQKSDQPPTRYTQT